MSGALPFLQDWVLKLQSHLYYVRNCASSLDWMPSSCGIPIYNHTQITIICSCAFVLKCQRAFLIASKYFEGDYISVLGHLSAKLGLENCAYVGFGKNGRDSGLPSIVMEGIHLFYWIFYTTIFALSPFFQASTVYVELIVYHIYTFPFFLNLKRGSWIYLLFCKYQQYSFFFFFFTSASSFVVPFFFDYSILLSSRLNYWVRIEMSCGTAYVWGLNRIIWKTLQATWNWNLPRLVGMSLTDALMIKTIGTTNSHLTFYCCFLKNAPLVS